MPTAVTISTLPSRWALSESRSDGFLTSCGSPHQLSWKERLPSKQRVCVRGLVARGRKLLTHNVAASATYDLVRIGEQEHHMVERRVAAEPRLRGDHHRRRRLRHLPAVSAGRARCEHHGARERRRPRRHVVLEPLPRRPLRFREHHLRLLVLGGAAAGVGLEGAVLRPAREPPVPELRRRQVRPPQAHAVRLHGRVRPVRRRRHPVAAAPRRRPRADVPVPDHGDRAAVGADAAALRGPRHLRGPVVPHLQLAGRAGGAGRASGWP